MIGRPSIFTQDKADAVCAELAQGRSLRSVCKDDDMPSMTTVFKWLREREDFAQQYARAKDECADALVEEMLDIADTPLEGVRTKTSEDGVEETREDMLGHRRLQVDTRKWIASKLKPKKYGERTQHEHSGKLTLESLVADSE